MVALRTMNIIKKYNFIFDRIILEGWFFFFALLIIKVLNKIYSEESYTKLLFEHHTSSKPSWEVSKVCDPPEYILFQYTSNWISFLSFVFSSHVVINGLMGGIIIAISLQQLKWLFGIQVYVKYFVRSLVYQDVSIL